eukprot:m.333661 g.333661  ORF g.333661 m.333661 type:complete len:245 (+) comp55652_c0_seq3:164-898(+)
MDAEDHTAHLRGALTRAAFKDAIVASFFHYITELSLAGVHAIAVIYRPVFLSRCISDRVNVGAAQGSQESSENVAPLLLHVPLCVNLTRLSLKWCNLEDVSNLARIDACTQLTSINLAVNRISEVGALADALSRCPNLETVDFHGNRLSDSEAPALVRLLKACTKLEQLLLFDNKFTDAVLDHFALAVATHPALHFLRSLRYSIPARPRTASSPASHVQYHGGLQRPARGACRKGIRTAARAPR